MTAVVLRSTPAQKYRGLGKSAFYERIAKGLLPQPISLGGHAVGFLVPELDGVLAARAAGLPDEQIERLVRDLIDVRAYVDASVRRAAALARYLKPARAAAG